MNFKFIIILSLAALLTGLNAFADTVLIPERESNFATYKESCAKAGYICTDRWILDLYTKKETPFFDELINSVDLSSKLFLQKFTKDLTNILQTEMLSEEQLDMALNLITQVRELADNKNQLNLIEGELKNIKDLFSKSVDASANENFVILFKKSVADADFKKMKASLLKIPAVHFNYASVPQELDTRLRTFPPNIYLLEGKCDKATLNQALTATTWQPFQDKSCSFTESISSASHSVSTAVSNNRNWILTGALVVGAAILLNQYEVKFQF